MRSILDIDLGMTGSIMGRAMANNGNYNGSTLYQNIRTTFSQGMKVMVVAGRR